MIKQRTHKADSLPSPKECDMHEEQIKYRDSHIIYPQHPHTFSTRLLCRLERGDLGFHLDPDVKSDSIADIEETFPRDGENDEGGTEGQEVNEQAGRGAVVRAGEGVGNEGGDDYRRC